MSNKHQHPPKPKQLPRPQQVRHDVMTDAEKRWAQLEAIRSVTKGK